MILTVDYVIGDKFRGTILNSESGVLNEEKVYTVLPSNIEILVQRVHSQPLSFTCRSPADQHNSDLDSVDEEDEEPKEEPKIITEVRKPEVETHPSEDERDTNEEDKKESPYEITRRQFSVKPSLLSRGDIIIDPSSKEASAIHASKRLMVEFHFCPECPSLLLLSKGFQFEILSKSYYSLLSDSLNIFVNNKP